MTCILCFWNSNGEPSPSVHSHLPDGRAAVRESAGSGLFCGGRTDVTELSLENDGVGRLRRRRRRQRANGCRGSSRDPPSLYLWWGGGGEVQVCVAGPSIHHQGGPGQQEKKTHRAHTGWNVSSILPDEGCVRRKQDAIAIHPLLALQRLRTPFKSQEEAAFVVVFFFLII